MASIPDSWPPEPDPLKSDDSASGGAAEDDPSPAKVRAPVFPLPGVFLFPGQIMPLHVFEPRYRQMIEDSLDGPGRLVIGTVTEKHRGDLSGAPPFLGIAGVGEIARHEKLPDGRFLIWLCGVGRARVAEIECDRLYRCVEYEVLREQDALLEDDLSLRPQLQDAIRDRAGDAFDRDEAAEAPLGLLADVLTQTITVPEPVLVELHGETDVAERARKALAAHERFPAAPRDRGQKPDSDEAS